MCNKNFENSWQIQKKKNIFDLQGKEVIVLPENFKNLSNVF